MEINQINAILVQAFPLDFWTRYHRMVHVLANLITMTTLIFKIKIQFVKHAIILAKIAQTIHNKIAFLAFKTNL